MVTMDCNQVIEILKQVCPDEGRPKNAVIARREADYRHVLSGLDAEEAAFFISLDEDNRSIHIGVFGKCFDSGSACCQGIPRVIKIRTRGLYAAKPS